MGNPASSCATVQCATPTMCRQLNRTLRGRHAYKEFQNAFPGCECEVSRVEIRPQGMPVSSHFSLEDNIGEGGYSKVHRCTQKLTGIKRACKIMDKTASQSYESVAKTEIEILCILQRAGRGRNLIVRLLEVFEDQKFVHLILELCVGGELYQRQSQIGVFAEMQARHLVQQMLTAVSHLHRNFIAHRDLKLENWLLVRPAPSLELRLCDFGLSVILKPGENARDRVGSVYYVAPEVLNGCYDQRADIWSVGVILFMMLSGLPPFDGASPEEILRAIVVGDVSFRAAVWRNVSNSPKGFIQELLARDSETRPSADEALENSWVSNSLTEVQTEQ